MPMSYGSNCCFVKKLQLQNLVDNALLEHAETMSWEVSIHDLYREFAEKEAQGKLMAVEDMEKRTWVYARDAFPTEMEDELRSIWKNLTRVCISETYAHKKESRIRGVSAIEWKYCTNLVVLKLDGLSELCGNLNFKDLKRLRSLTVVTTAYSHLKFSIEGLEGLESLTYFRMHCGADFRQAYVGKLPAALKVLELSGCGIEFMWKGFALCTNLVSLKLRGVRTSDFGLIGCYSLEKVELGRNGGLEILELGIPSVGQLPAALKVLEVDVVVVFERDVLALCTNLVSLKLRGVCISDLDLNSCFSLEKVELDGNEVFEEEWKLMALDTEKPRWVYARDALPTEMDDEPRSSQEE